MIISFWRYCHLALAISSFVFLLLAAVSGAILAIEPVLEEIDAIGLKVDDSQPLYQLLDQVDAHFEEVFSIKKNSYGSIEVHGIYEGEDQTVYVNPESGKPASEVKQQAPFFQFITNLHRSLFLGSFGRALLGINSFLLLLIAATGFVLILKRTGRFLGFFEPVINTNNYSFLHIISGKWTIVPLMIIALSGVLLSLVRFSIIPSLNIVHAVDYDLLEESPELIRSEFPVFSSTTLKDFREIEFPFFEDPEEFYRLGLTNGEVLVNQFTGKIESEQAYPWTVMVSSLSIVLHTGQGNWIWALILGVASLAIPLFVYSGFTLTFQRRKGLIRNKYAKDDCDYVVLVGSENGSTTRFAKAFQQALISAERKVYLEELNSYGHYASIKHLVVFTATYGVGDPPSNATKFVDRFLETNGSTQAFAYSVVGFGSTSYPDFCKYAYQVNGVLNTHATSKEFLPVHTVNNQSFESFTDWVNRWGVLAGIPITISDEHISNEFDGELVLKVIRKTDLESSVDDTFLLFLEVEKGPAFQSGDLLAVTPPGEKRARFYSIGVLNKTSFVLSIKWLEQGRCSNYLSASEQNQTITGHLKRNPDFHFPQKKRPVVMIATGTGIGPFMGMIENNILGSDITLYWGGKYDKSLKLYKNYIDDWIEDGKLTSLHTAFSRQYGNKKYVQHLIERDAEKVAHVLKSKGVVMICGSIAMQQGVTTVLSVICEKSLGKPLNFFINRQQVRMDCY
ncbi:MAG: PepSY domain-containing protein [Bacteroidota bacterium]